jgi:HTH-type transcriptional regulator / antitoxin HigA
MKTLPTAWHELNRLHRMTVIRSERDYDAARRVVQRLAVLDRPTTDQRDYLETLTLLMEAYEKEHYPIRSLRGVAALRALVVQHEMSASDLGRLLGNRSLGTKVLAGQRELSKANIAALAEHFRVDPGIFLVPRRVGRRPSAMKSSRATCSTPRPRPQLSGV